MKLDRTFSTEIKKANGNGSREARFSFLKPARAAAGELSTTNVFDVFDDVLRKYGRATVGVCLAATIMERQERLEPKTVRWAIEVMKLWTNRAPINIEGVIIRDGLHPCKIERYAGSFIRFTTEEA